MSISESDQIMIKRLGEIIADTASGQGKVDLLLKAAQDLLESAVEIEWDLATTMSQAKAHESADWHAQRSASIRVPLDGVHRAQEFIRISEGENRPGYKFPLV